MKTMCPHGYQHSDFITTHAYGKIMHCYFYTFAHKTNIL